MNIPKHYLLKHDQYIDHWAWQTKVQ